MSFIDEIHQQPEVLKRIIQEQWEPIQALAARIQERGIEYIFLAARGTSDNAGLYAKYLLGSANRLPIALAAPSLFSIYENAPRLANCLVMGISQSGKSPDIVRVIEEGRKQGQLTVAISNSAGSPLANAADIVIDLCAGEEKAVAASKTYTAQLLVIALLSAALSGEKKKFEQIGHLPELVDAALETGEVIRRQAERYTFMQQCVVLGRGYNYASAFEWALKLKELCYTAAEAYSSADFQHGPIALLEHRFPILAVMPEGKVYPDMLQLAREMQERHNVELVILSNQAQALQLGHTPLPIPQVPEWLSPIVSIIPAQLFCYHLTCAKGFDPDAPRGLRKVTETW
jgi:glucosamine--fructose-6-phosphate aminotransferase (isomerizing)